MSTKMLLNSVDYQQIRSVSLQLLFSAIGELVSTCMVLVCETKLEWRKPTCVQAEDVNMSADELQTSQTPALIINNMIQAKYQVSHSRSQFFTSAQTFSGLFPALDTLTSAYNVSCCFLSCSEEEAPGLLLKNVTSP